MYGTPGTGNQAWSIRFDNIPHDQFGFVSNNFDKYIVVDKAELLG